MPLFFAKVYLVYNILYKINLLENLGHLGRFFYLEHCLLAILILYSDSDGLTALWLFVFGVGHGCYYSCCVVVVSCWVVFCGGVGSSHIVLVSMMCFLYEEEVDFSIH